MRKLSKNDDVQMIPKSCCDPNQNERECIYTPTTANGNYHVGCYAKIEGYVKDHSAAIIGCSVAILVVMVLDLVFACYLWCCHKEERPDKKKYGKTRSRDY